MSEQVCWVFDGTTDTRPETKEERAARLEQARDAAAKALFDQYERWNDRAFSDNAPTLKCKQHNKNWCPECTKTK